MKRILISLVVLVFIGGIGSCIFLFYNYKEGEKNIVPVYEEKKKTYTEEANEATLTLVGDLLFETNYYNAINSGDDKEQYFHLVKDYFSKDDLSIGNMEVVIGNPNMPVRGGDNYNFSAHMGWRFSIKFGF